MISGSKLPPCEIRIDLFKKSLSFTPFSSDFSPDQGLLPCFGHTHPFATNIRFLTIHKLLNANSVMSCAVFFTKPR